MVWVVSAGGAASLVGESMPIRGDDVVSSGFMVEDGGIVDGDEGGVCWSCSGSQVVCWGKTR